MLIPPIRSTEITPGRRQPDGTKLVGYAAMIHALGVEAPFPDPVAVVSDRRVRPDTGRRHALRDGFAVYESSYGTSTDKEKARDEGPDPFDSFEGHLNFALRHEKDDLLALRRIFLAVDPETMVDYVRKAPTSGPRRRAWFLHEWLTGRRLDLPDASAGPFVDALDGERWHVARATVSSRHRVRDNMPGTPVVCPLVARSATVVGDGTVDLARYVERRVARLIGDVRPDEVSTLSRRLLLKDSRSTFQIESETPSQDMANRWSDIVARSGREPFTQAQFDAYQRVVMAGRRGIALGLRHEGVYLGGSTGNVPEPKWIGAKPEDLRRLMDNLFEVHQKLVDSEVDPVAHAASVSFCMLYVHSWADGNGRLSRLAMQAILDSRGVRPHGIALPVSKSIWVDLQGYHDVLRSLDIQRMPFIRWEPTARGNVRVLNETADLYGLFDASEHARFVMRCVDRTLDHDIPEEIDELRRRQRLVEAVRTVAGLDLNAPRLDLLTALVRQNAGRLSKAKRKRDFASLSDEQVEELEELVRETYDIELPGQASVPGPR